HLIYNFFAPKNPVPNDNNALKKSHRSEPDLYQQKNETLTKLFIIHRETCTVETNLHPCRRGSRCCRLAIWTWEYKRRCNGREIRRRPCISNFYDPDKKVQKMKLEKENMYETRKEREKDVKKE
uniref:Uncharacterized protein n=1 Tax=Romanomermis culicivorax TaxID=13658 RepID=A0A915HLD7_ROMCU